MSFDFSRLPDSILKWRIIAMERQLRALEDRGGLQLQELLDLRVPFTALEDETRAFMRELLKMENDKSATLFYQAYHALGELLGDVVRAANLKILQDFVREDKTPNAPN